MATGGVCIICKHCIICLFLYFFIYFSFVCSFFVGFPKIYPSLYIVLYYSTMYNVDMMLFTGEGFCAQSWEQFLASAQKVGFTHPRLLKIGSIVIGKEVREKLGKCQWCVQQFARGGGGQTFLNSGNQWEHAFYTVNKKCGYYDLFQCCQLGSFRMREISFCNFCSA